MQPFGYGNVNGLTAQGMLIGTPWYRAPKQAGDVPPLADIVSVGMIVFEMLAGFRPYRSDNPDEGPLTFLQRYTKVAQGAGAATQRNPVSGCQGTSPSALVPSGAEQLGSPRRGPSDVHSLALPWRS